MKTITENQLSRDFIEALDDLSKAAQEPLLIDLHGKKFVVLKEEEYRKFETGYLHSSSKNKPQTNLADFFRNSPLYGENLDLERDKSPSRDVKL
ncbi:MAG: hypothetical protein GY795_20685 [Desulfobacterales bacterium]|nr:hypothetical protein [Desulfobacterales bacterium]